MDRQSIVMQALDSNAFKSTDTAAGYVNPSYWDRQVLAAAQSNLVTTQLAKVYNNLEGDGSVLYVTVATEPAAAAALTESTAASVVALNYTQVTFTPTEYGTARQVTDKESRRAFFDLMTDITSQLGYALARKREDFATDLLAASAGNAVVANGVASSTIASSDTLDWNDIVNGMGRDLG